MTSPPATDLLTQYLRRDAGAREASVVGFMRWIAPVTALMALSLWPLLGRGHTLWLVAALGAVSVYYWLQTWLLRGGFRPWMQFANVAVEVSAPSALFLLDLHYQGAIYALTAPPIFIWATLILLSALRSNQRLAIFAGTLAATEYLVLYFAFALPRLATPYLVTLSPQFVLIRAFLLFAAGVATSILASHLVRLSGKALRTIREEDVMGKYQLEAPIGKGGMAEVFRAVYCPEGGFRKVVALKRIHEALTSNPQFVSMFRRETYLGSLLNHPNIVQVHDAGRHHGRYFLAMEYVDGLSLAAALSAMDRPLPLAALTYLGAEIAEGLFYIHSRTDDHGHPLGLVHRDLNPPNILISHRGDVKLGDFGIARTNTMEALTAQGDVRGKLRFMAPEQVRGEPVDARTDLFGLGLTLYLALTGHSLFSGASPAALMDAVLNREPSSPSLLRADVPPELDVAIVGLLRKQASHRTPSGKELRDRLCLIRGVAAPYPHGKDELAAFVNAALAQLKGGGPKRDPWAAAAPIPEVVAGPEVTESVERTVTARNRPNRKPGDA